MRSCFGLDLAFALSLTFAFAGQNSSAQSVDNKKVIINQKPATPGAPAKPGTPAVPGKAAPKAKAQKSALENVAPIDTNFKEPSNYNLYEVPEMEPVMSKKYNLNNEIAGHISYLPVGAFNKYASLGGSYVRYFDKVHGWEVLNASYAFELESQLKKDLKDYYGAQEKDFPVLQWMVTSNYVYSPFYTKSVLLNKRQVYSQLSFIAGAGLANYKIKTVTLLEAGVTQRFFSEGNTSLKFDFRYMYFLGADAILRNQLALTFGWAYHFGGTQ